MTLEWRACRPQRTALPSISYILEMANNLPWTYLYIQNNQSRVHTPQPPLSNSHTPANMPPAPNHPRASTWYLGTTPIAQGLNKLFKLLNPKLFKVPCLAFPEEIKIKACAHAFSSWVPWPTLVLPYMALHRMLRCLFPDIYKCKRPPAWKSFLSACLTIPDEKQSQVHFSTHKSNSNPPQRPDFQLQGLLL